VNKNKMAVESFFVIETSFSDLREKLKEEIVRVDKEYDENTICYDYGLVLMLFKEFFQQKQIPLYILS
jgi:oligopeptidase B